MSSSESGSGEPAPWQWTDGPPTAGDDAQLWAFWDQFRHAIGQRYAVVTNQTERCCGVFPSGNQVWGQFTVGSVTLDADEDGHTLIVPGDGTFVPQKCADGNFDWTTGCDDPETFPSSWDIVIDDCDPTKVVRCHVVANEPAELSSESSDGGPVVIDPGSFTTTPLNDYVTSKFIPSAASLIGKKAYLIKAGGYWWSEMIAQWPNDQEFARGNVYIGTSHNLTIADGEVCWKGDLTGKDLLVVGDDGPLHRVEVLSNTNDTITFGEVESSVTSESNSTGQSLSSQSMSSSSVDSWKPEGTFIVVASGDKGDPRRQPHYSYQWDRSAQKTYYSHAHDDATDGGGNPPGANLPARVITWEDGVFPTCDDQECNSFLGDCRSGLDNECSEPDDIKNPLLFSTIRGLWLAALGLHGYFIDPQTGVPLTIATWFYRAGVNAQKVTSSGTDGSDNLLVSLTVPYEPITVWYAVLGQVGCADTDGVQDILASGQATYEDGMLIGDFSDATKFDDPREVVVTLGATRTFPREVRYIDGDRTVFIADQQANAIDCGDEAPAAADPPNVANFDLCGCLGTGFYEHRGGPSQTYAEAYTGDASAQPPGMLIDGPDAFVDGEYARYIGDNFIDPSVFGPTEVTSPAWYQAKYYDRLYEGRHPRATQSALIAQLSGTVASGGSYYLNQFDHNWWNEFWYPTGTGRDETGTFTSGSTTGGADDTKGASWEIVGFDPETEEPIYGWVASEEGCFWQSSRWAFIGGTPYQNFVIEIQQDGKWHKRVIRTSSQDDTGISVEWDEPLPATANGCAYSIREAYGYAVNRFRGKKLTLIEPDGETEHEVTIIANDDRTLFWDEGDFDIANASSSSQSESSVAPDGPRWTFRIEDVTVDPGPGRVYQWQAASDSSASSDSTGQWIPAPAGTQPTMVTRYGLFPWLRDYATALHVAQQLYALINVLKDTYKTPTVSSREDDDVAEDNAKSVDFPGHSCGSTSAGCFQHWSECWQNLLDLMACNYNLSNGMGCDGFTACGDNPTDDGHAEEAGLPLAEWVGNASQCDTMNGMGVHRRYAYVSVSGISTCVPVAVEIWAKAQAHIWACPSNADDIYGDDCGDDHPATIQFDTNGDGDFGWGTWGKVTTLTEVSDDGSTVKYRIGDQSLPIPAEAPQPCDPDPTPTNPCGYAESYKGYRMTGIRAVLKWCFDEHAPSDPNCA